MSDPRNILLDVDIFSSDAEAQGLAVLERLAVQEAALYAAQARQLHDSALLSERLQGPSGPERFLVIDVAATLRTGQLAAQRRLADAHRLVQTLPVTLAALETGALLLPQARTVLEQTSSCTDDVAAEVDRRLHACGDLTGWTARRLRDRLARLVLQVEADQHPQQTADRLQTARAGRRVSVRPEPDGMASLWALLPAEQLRAFTAGLDELTRRQRHTDRAHGVQRTADQRRADLLAQLPALALHALDGTTPSPCTSPAGGAGGICPGGVGHPAVVVSVHVPVATALGLSDAPGDLDGYGPVSAAQVRLLLPDATLRQVLVDARTGEPLHADPTLHRRSASRTHRTQGRARTATGTAGSECGSGSGASSQIASSGTAGDGTAGDGTPGASPPDAVTRARLMALVPDQPMTLLQAAEAQHDPSRSLALLVRIRDPLCTGPGCSTSSDHCDLDHEQPYPGGPTAPWNLRPKSRRCHRAKTLTWQVTRSPDGTHTWTSPARRTYTVPATWTPPPARRHPPQRRPHPRTTAPDDRPEQDDDDLVHVLAAPGDERPPTARRTRDEEPPF